MTSTLSRLRVCTLAAVCLAAVANSVAQPSSPAVVAGSATFSSSPGTLTISQASGRAIINWQEFTIATGQSVRFVQPDALSATLNRVVSGAPSTLLGNLEANGSVYLINPNGVLVGAGARIDTGGFLASTLDVSDADFLRGGDLLFRGESTAAVQNLGAINALGGDVFLIAKRVENAGTITADGIAGLAAGSEVLLTTGGSERVFVQAASAPGEIVNAGQIAVTSAELKAAGGNAYALAINNSGVVRATGSEARDGQVWLVANGGGVEAGGTLAASSADGARGGEVRVLGERVTVSGLARVEVSGANSGGTVLIGGDFQGKNANVTNARTTTIAAGARINADATTNGEGGRVIVWSDEATDFAGVISARGGVAGGDGGFAEVSGKATLRYHGTTDLRAPHGISGTLLLDPKNIVIATGGADALGANDEFGENPTGTSTIDPSAIVTALDSASVVLQANNDITVSDAIFNSNGWENALTFQAGRSIAFNADVQVDGDLIAVANYAGGQAAQRDAGDATITLAAGVKLDNWDGGDRAMTLQLGAGPNGNDPAGAISLEGTIRNALGTVTIATNGATAGNRTISLGPTTTANLTVNSAGGITQTGALSMISVARTNLNAGTNDITLTDASNALGRVDFTGGDVTLNHGATAAFTLHGTATGDLTATAPNIATTATLYGGTSAGGTLTFTTNNALQFAQYTTGHTTVSTSGGASGAISIQAGGRISLPSFLPVGFETQGAPVSLIAGGTNADLTVGASAISTNGGAITLRANQNVLLSQATLTSGGGAVIVNSDADASGAGSITMAANSAIRSAGGRIELAGGSAVDANGYLIGRASGSGTSISASAAGASGILINGATIDSAGGAIRLLGQGSTSVANDAAVGIFMTSATTIDAGTGTVLIDGLSRASGGTGNMGVNLRSAQPGAAGTGNVTITSANTTASAITINGQGPTSGTSTNSSGINLQDATSITATGGIILTGTGGAAAAASNNGVNFENGTGIVVATNSGPLMLNGTAGNASGAGIKVNGTSTVALGGASMSRALTLTSDKIDFVSSNVTVQGTGDLLVQPLSPAQAIDLGSGAGLSLSQSAIDTLADGFESITIGRADGTGAITVNAAVSFKDTVTLRSPAGSGSITVDGALSTGSGSEAGRITLQAGNQISLSAGSSITTAGQPVTLNADRDANGTGSIAVDAGAAITTSGGGITLGGGNDPATDAASGANYGVRLRGSLDAGDGAVTIRGQATATTGNNNYGVNVEGGSVNTSGAGAIMMVGAGAPSSGNTNYGVGLNTDAVIEATGSGSITITGTGGGAPGSYYNDGVAIHWGSTIASATGAIAITGTAGITTGANSSNGISFQGSAGTVESSGSAAITLTGTGVGSASSGLYFGNASMIGGASATGDITFTTDNITFGSPSFSVQSSGALLLQPMSVSTSIGIGNGSGTLVLPQAGIDTFADGFESITIGRSDSTGELNLGDATFNDDVTIRSGTGAIAMNSGRTITTNGNDFTAIFGNGGTISGDIATGAGDLTITSTGVANLDLEGANLSTTTGDLALTLGSGVSGGNRLRFTNNALVTTVDGSITVTARDDNGWLLLGEDTGSTGGITATGSGDITVNLTNNLFLRNGYRIAGNGGDITANAARFATGNVGSAAATLSNPTGRVSLNITNGVDDGSQSVINAGSLELTGDGSFDFTSGTTSIGTIAADVAGSVTVLNNTGLTVGTVGSTSGVSAGNNNNVTLVTTSGSIALDQAITTTGSGDITLATAANFINSFGTSALGVDTGRWLVWSASPLLDTRGGLTPDFKQYGATYGTSTVLGSGNGFLYRISPTITIALSGTAEKTYDGDDEASLDDITVTASGAIDGDTITVSAIGASYDNKNAGENKNVTATGVTGTAVNGDIDVYGYVIPSSASDDIGEVTPAALSITADSATKTYGEAVIFGGDEFASDGLQNGETVGSVTLGSAGAVATAGVSDSPYAITASAATGGTFNASNYTITYHDGELTITPKEITVTAAGGASTYGDAPANPGFTAEGLVNEETVSVLAGLANSFGIGASTNAGDHTLSVTGTLSNANYTITEREDGTWTVTPRVLTITADDATKIYGHITTFVGDEFTPVGLQNGETVGSVTLASSGSSATADVANSPYAITATGAAGGTFNPDNYTITYENGALTINPKEITVTATGGTSTYGDTPTNPGFTADGLVNEETVAVLSGLTNSFGIGATTGAGDHAVSVAGTLANANYTVTEREDGTWTVARRALTITANDLSKTYGDEFTYDGDEFEADGLQNSETIESVTLASAGAAATAGVEDSPYIITTSGATGGTFDADNYTISYENGTLTVRPKEITVTATGGTSIYGDTPTNPGLTVEGLVNDEAVSVLAGLTNNFGIGATTNAGDHTLSVTGTLSNANYTITERDDGTWTVSRRALTITADDASKTYGDALTFAGDEFAADGLQNDETVGSVTLASTGAGATADMANSPYTITASGATGGTFDINNYTVTYENGGLTITPKEITVTATGGASVYGDTPDTPGFSASGLVNDETVSVLTGLANSFGIGATTNAGNHDLSVDGTLTNANYTITQRNDGTWTVTPRALSITSDDQNKVYGETFTFDGTEFESSGLQNGETIGTVTLGSTGAMATAGVADSPYAITASAATGGTFNAGNYTITYHNGALTIAPKEITVTATGGTSVYGDMPANPGFTANGLVNDDTVSVLTGLANSFGIGATTNAGGHDFSVEGALTNANYTITQRHDGTWTITPRALSITADDASKTYGDAFTFAGDEFAADGLQNGETVGSVTLASTGAGATAGVANSPYTITASGATGGTFDASNYTITYHNGALTITPKEITVTATGGTSTYGDAPTNSGFTASGLVNEETIAVLTGLANSFGIGASSSADDHTLSVDGTLTNANYMITQRSDGTWTVTPRALSITADDAAKTYGELYAWNGDEFESSGLQNDETIGSVTMASTGAAASAGVSDSPFAITATNATGGTFNASNYTITYHDGALTIAPKEITVTAAGGTSTYGDTPGNPGITASGLTNEETLAVLTGLANSFGIGATTNAGDHTLSVDGTLTNANYTITQRNDGTWVVTPRALSIMADDANKTYGDVISFNGDEFESSGLQNDESIGSVTLASDGAVETAGVGDSPYVITASAATGGTFNEDNYSITYENGALTITPRELVVTMDADQTKIYGDADPELTYTLGGGGLVNGDTLSGAPVRATGESVGDYTFTQGSLETSDNYTFTFAGDSFVITPRAITLTANPVSRVYGAADPALGVSLTAGTLGSVTVNDSLTDVIGTLTRQSGANVGGYDILLGTGTAAANYTITYNADNNAFTISPAPLTITADDVTRDFGRVNPDFTAKIDGLVNNDTTDVVSGLAFNTQATTGSAVGDYAITPFGASAGNYTISFVDGTLTVEAAVIAGETPVEVPTINGTPVISDTIAVIILGDRLVIVPINNNQVAGGSIDNDLTVMLGEVTSIPRPTSTQNIAGAGNQISGINFSGFEVVATLGSNSGGGGGGTAGALSDLPPDSGLFRESSMSMGKFNVVYREVIDRVRELSEENTIFESSFENLPDDANPQVVLLKAAPLSAPREPEVSQNNS